MNKLIITTILVAGCSLFCGGCGAGSSAPDETTLHQELSGPPSSPNIRAHKGMGVGQKKAGVNVPQPPAGTSAPAGGATGQ